MKLAYQVGITGIRGEPVYDFIETDSLNELKELVNVRQFQNVIIDWDNIDWISGVDGLIRPFNDLVDDIL